jgi:hypothetical protein
MDFQYLLLQDPPAGAGWMNLVFFRFIDRCVLFLFDSSPE